MGGTQVILYGGIPEADLPLMGGNGKTFIRKYLNQCAGIDHLDILPDIGIWNGVVVFVPAQIDTIVW